MDLEQSAFEALRFASAQSLKLYKQPLVITYSGGKDSDVLLRLAENSGIPFEVLHSLTTADAPETVLHVRDTFRRMEEKGVKCVIDAHVQADGKRVTMWNLIPKKMMPPTRLMRYCCEKLKEVSGKGRFIATGVRWAESPKRRNGRGLIEVQAHNAKQKLMLMEDNDEGRMQFENCKMKGKRIVNPIIGWEDKDVWDYVEEEQICMNPLYGCGLSAVHWRQNENAWRISPDGRSINRRISGRSIGCWRTAGSLEKAGTGRREWMCSTHGWKTMCFRGRKY